MIDLLWHRLEKRIPDAVEGERDNVGDQDYEMVTTKVWRKLKQERQEHKKQAWMGQNAAFGTAKAAKIKRNATTTTNSTALKVFLY